MSWVNYSVVVPRERAQAAEAALTEAGARSVSATDAGASPVLEPAPGETRLWPSVRVAGLFPRDADPDRVRLRLAATLGEAGLEVERVELADRDWSRAWLDRLEPMRFGARLWIVPGDRETPHVRGAVPVRLDPGLAFGTGTHPTTALCLEWLDAHAPVDGTVLDYGCGSGVLGLAAAALGAGAVWCTDHDPQALTATRDNAKRNGLETRIRAVRPNDLPHLQADALLANILLKPLLALRDPFAALLKAGGALVLSGLLAGQRDQLIAHYRGPFDAFDTAERDDWVRVTAIRNRAN